MREQRPERFGNYDIIEPINTGGMGEVYLARQRSAFDRLVAIKIIRSDKMYDNTARARFLREAEVSAHLKHEHILPLIEFNEDQGRLYLVTPYIEGGTLERRLRSGPLSLQEVRQLFVPLGQAVAYIHRRGVVHRDLKPSNILLDEQDGQVYVRLIDFGIATVQGGKASPPLTTSSSEVVGTLVYMAPERLDGVAAASNDIFSLGIILHQMLTGNLPMGEQIDDMPDPLREVVARCIELRPEDRFATVDDVLKHFERAYQLISSPTQPNSVRLSPLDRSTINRVNPSAAPAPEPFQSEKVMLESTGRASLLPPETGEPVSLFDLGPGGHSAQTLFFHSSQQGGYSSAVSSSPASPIPASRLTPIEPPSQVVRPPRKYNRRSLLPLLAALTAAVTLAVAFLAYYGYQTITTTSVTVNFSPKVLALSNSYTITASLSAQSVDVTNATIPLHSNMSSKQASMSGPATGQECYLGIFNCQTVVSPGDVDGLAKQERPGLRESLTQTLDQQVASAGGTKIADITFNETVSPDPGIGMPSNTVTVTLTEQATVAYYITTDAQGVARQLLAQQAQRVGANYVLTSNTIEIGQPMTGPIDRASDKVLLKVAAGGDVAYQFPTSQLRAIQNALRGKTVKAAQMFLINQPGIDTASIHITFTQGNSATLPGDIQHIIVAPINAVNYPVIQLDATPHVATSPSPSPATTQHP